MVKSDDLSSQPDMDIAGLVLDFIHGYGLLAIFILLIMDGALLLPVFPGEVVMIIAVTAYVHDSASLVFIILLATVAGLLGSLLLYAITRGGGRRLVERFPRLFMMPRKRRERMERAFSRPIGQTLVLFLRLFPLTRVLVNIPAGLAKMPVIRFTVMSLIGLLVYHTAFLWFTYEAQRPGSPIATQKAELQETYGGPAWNFVETNAIIAGTVILLFAVVWSVRAALRMRRDPEETTGSLLGWFTTMLLLWGGAALAVATYLEPQMLHTWIALGGVDMDAVAVQVGYGAVPILFAVAGVAMFLGYVLARVRARARQHRKRVLAQKAARPTMRATGRASPIGVSAAHAPDADPARRPPSFTILSDPDAVARTSRTTARQRETGIRTTHEADAQDVGLRARLVREQGAREQGQTTQRVPPPQDAPDDKGHP